MTHLGSSATGYPAQAAGLIDRRTLLRGSAALAALVATPGIAAPLLGSQPAIRYVITDARIPESLAFGEEMAGHGAERLELTEGLTALWQERLVPHWRQASGLVVGLTSRAVWDGLSQQALGQFRKPRLLGDHRLDAQTGGLHHVLGTVAPADTMARLRDGNAWPGAVAAIMRDCAAAASSYEAGCEVRDGSTGSQSTNQLISWMVI